MRHAVLGTGVVGRTIAGKLSSLGHEVVVGTRDPQATLARTQPDGYGNPPYARWQAEHPQVRLAAFADAAAQGEVVLNATEGLSSLRALESAGAANLAGKIVIDIANPLDFSRGMPPSLDPVNTDSLGEQIQRAFTEAKVVKTLNTMNARIMVDPARVPGAHTVFVSGDDAEAKGAVTDLLRSFGWPADDIIDLGDITTARGAEMLLPIWLRLYGALGHADFNFHIQKAHRSA
ncbi:NADPH-dependent F420 reductase [Streptomyces heilongjiangensis]|uniref:NADPH-dependent F420 reductase n=1 Tax=Streptomyces heilongjiangensis TaxID=945052 RepID=A0ABW1B4N9_9ACTN|nr:NAD(P)-binding domain-containing protein [Streptomyces heilongjiangensis]MDC2951749.1 NAD(P)-binding domain-containing protein [Streptomyces heilongjiangensis]